MKRTVWQKRLLITLAVGAAGILLPTTLLLFLGMLPTLIVLLFDQTVNKSRVVTVGAMNAAGCMPFVLELWSRGHTVNIALEYAINPRTIIVMYMAAGIGYMIEWVMTGLVAGIMVQKAKTRISEIEKRQNDLETRWGPEVTGEYQLDEEGFAAEHQPK